MPRLKKYIEATKHLTKRVPASQLQKCHEIIDEYLTPFEAPKSEPIEQPKIKLKQLTKPNWLKVENAEQIKAMRDFCIKSNQLIWTEYLERDCKGLIYPVYFQYKNDHIGERFLVTNWDKKYITHDQVIYEFNQLER